MRLYRDQLASRRMSVHTVHSALEDRVTAIRYAEHSWFQSLESANSMPLDRPAVEKLDGYLLRGLRGLRGAILGLGREASLYGIHTSAICEFEAYGQRLRDERIGRGPREGGKVGRREGG